MGLREDHDGREAFGMETDRLGQGADRGQDAIHPRFAAAVQGQDHRPAAGWIKVARHIDCVAILDAMERDCAVEKTGLLPGQGGR